MNLRRVKSFIKIVEMRSFSDAAQALHMTQSAVSKQVKALEDELGVPLLTRNAACVEPTGMGRYVYERGLQMIDAWDRLAEECRQASGESSGRLAISASTVPAAYLLPRIARNLKSEMPQLELTVKESGSEAVLTQIEKGETDLGFVGTIRSSSSLRYVPIVEDTLVIVGADERPEHGAEDEAAGEPSLSELLRRPFVVRDEHSGTQQAFREAVRVYGLSADQLKVAAVASTTESALALAQAGVGVTVVSKWALSLPRPLRLFAELKTNRCFYAVYHTSRENDPLIRRFLLTAGDLYEMGESSG